MTDVEVFDIMNDTPVNDSSRSLVHVIHYLHTSLEVQCPKLLSGMDLVVRIDLIQFCELLVIELVDRLQRSAVDDKRI